MKILILGFEYLNPDVLVDDENLVSFNRLMQIGCYGLVSTPVSSSLVNKWSCLLSSRYSSSNDLKNDDVQTLATSDELVYPSIDVHEMIWDAVIAPKKNCYIVGKLPFSVHKLDGVTFEEIDNNKIHETDEGDVAGVELLSRLQSTLNVKFGQIRAIIKSGEWDFIYSLDSGLAQLQSMEQKIDNQSDSILSSYYRNLDQQVGELIDELTDDTILMLVSLRSNKFQDYQKEEEIESSHDQPDYFMLAASNLLIRGEIENVQITDLAPSLLDLGGYVIPTFMEGKSFASGKMVADASSSDLSEEEQAILRERLSGLGYF